MGVDDHNEGRGPGECPGHEWLTVELVLLWNGAHMERVCRLCNAVTMVTSDELRGLV